MLNSFFYHRSEQVDGGVGQALQEKAWKNLHALPRLNKELLEV